MTANEAAIRKAYQVAEDKDVAGWVNCFTEQGTFTDQSIGVTYRGRGLGRTVEVYATNGKIQSFNCYPSGRIILVQLGAQL
jgi:hypothetical protein